MRNSRIVNSFLFSEAFEIELLLLKLQLENEGISEWIILENSFSFQGEYKGLHAWDIIDSDKRFSPYRSRITVISRERKIPALPKNQFLDAISFQYQFWQRDLAYDYFMENYNDDDWIMISDVDEMIDFSSPERKTELLEKMELSEPGMIKVPTLRYWFDFDNKYDILINNPMCNKKYLINSKKKLSEVRLMSTRGKEKNWRNIISFEYSSCFSFDNIISKINSCGHTGFTRGDIEQALRCNHRPTRELASWKADNSPYWFFETVGLTEKNSPRIVRENLQHYKTNNIDSKYSENRRKDYPELFTISHYIKKWSKHKQYFINKKLKAGRYKLRLILK